jgi:hypothetical protein
MIPPEKKMTVENSTTALAVPTCRRPIRENRNAITAVAKTEEAFHPEMHDGPAPVLDHGQMPLAPPHPSRREEQLSRPRGYFSVSRNCWMSMLPPVYQP